MNTRSIAALNTGPDFHLLDHIAPLAWHLAAPLLITEELNYQLALKYYPHIKIQYIDNLEFNLEYLTCFDVLIECKYWASHLKGLFKQLYGKTIDLVFCPHGQSDKGFLVPLLAPYAQQDAVLIYGDLLIDMLQKLNIWPAISRFARIGDFRLTYYHQHKSFYDEIAEREIFSRFQLDQSTLLYAPTWRDADESSSFFDQCKILLSQLPAHWNLIIKVHPLLKQRDPSRYESIIGRFESKPNALLIEDFPAVHPILNRTHAYLGDFSSIGYDFLYYKRPMFFFSHHTIASGRLHQCGRIIDPGVPIFSFIENNYHHHFQTQQEALYRYAFGSPVYVSEAVQKMLYHL